MQLIPASSQLIYMWVSTATKTTELEAGRQKKTISRPRMPDHFWWLFLLWPLCCALTKRWILRKQIFSVEHTRLSQQISWGKDLLMSCAAWWNLSKQGIYRNWALCSQNRIVHLFAPRVLLYSCFGYFDNFWQKKDTFFMQWCCLLSKDPRCKNHVYNLPGPVLNCPQWDVWDSWWWRTKGKESAKYKNHWHKNQTNKNNRAALRLPGG